MDAKQLQSLKASNEQLAGFIVRLTNFYEGLSPDIDAELGKLRGHLSGNVDFTLAKVSINKINQLFMLEPTNLKNLTQQWLRQLDNDIKEFQRHIEDAELTKKALGVATSLSKPVSSVGQILPLYEKLIKCYQAGLLGDVKTVSANNGDSNSKTVQLKQDLIDELSHLLQTYARINPDDALIASLRDRIDEELTEEELLSSCLLLIRIMVQETVTEASTAGKIIHRLNNALGNINGDVTSSISKSVESFEARQVRQKSLRSVLEDMEDALEGEQNIDQLKDQAQHYLGQLANSLSAGEEADRVEQEGLMTLLVSMQQQLSSLQKQTDSYRKKLVEQRVNMYTDPLTKVPNRMAYNERANKEWQKSQQLKQPMSIAVIDVDHFKRINDQYGHAAGDKTLQAIARYLKSRLHANEFLARWGGEEFILLIPELASTQLTERLDELRIGLAQLPFKFKQERLTVTVSIGGTECRTGEQLDAAFERADKCLYQAKAGGRNLVVVQESA